MSTVHVQSLLELLWRKQVDSRVEASRRLHVSRPTVSALVETLLARGIIQERGKGVSSGGKPPIILEMNPQAFHAVGIDVGYESVVRGLRMDAAGTIVRRQELPVGRTFADIVDAVSRLAVSLDCAHACGLGLAVSGMVNPSTGSIVRSANFDLTDRPLCAALQERLGQPVFLDNRARMSARAERFSGAARNRGDFGLISLGKSIGSAFCIGGRLYGGSNGMSGEIRNLPVPDYSGKGTMTLEDALRRDTLSRLASPDEQAARRCACGLRILLDIFEFDLLVLSGRFEELGRTFHRSLTDLLAADYDCLIEPAHFGHYSAACGAAIFAIENTVFDPDKPHGASESRP